MDPDLLRRTAEIADEYLTSLPERPVRAGASLDELRSALRVALEDNSQPALQVIEELVAAADPASSGRRVPGTSASSSAALLTRRSLRTG